MFLMDLMPLVSRWLHVLAVILLVGGTLFMRFALVPAIAESKVSDEAREAIRRRWAKWVGAAVLFLLASGLYNAALKAIDYQLDGVYLTLLALKIVLGFAIFLIVSLLNGRSVKAIKLREREMYWLNILCLMMVSLVMMAGYMKMSNQPLKAADKPSESTPAEKIEPAGKVEPTDQAEPVEQV